MSTKERYLIAVDLDDTILSELFSLNVRSVWSLINARDAGHVVMIATARPTCIALPYYRALGLNTLLSTVNGNYLYHPDDPAIPRIAHEISGDNAAEIVDAIHEYDLQHPWIHSDDDVYTLDGVYPGYPYFRVMFHASRVHRVDALPAQPCGRIFAIAQSEKQVRAMQARFANRNDLVFNARPNRDGAWNVTLHAATADKWYTVQEAARFYGIKEENIACFGDEMNDRLMVTSAAHGFAMCNGNKELVALMRAGGKGVTTYPCSEGGVGYEVDKLLGL